MFNGLPALHVVIYHGAALDYDFYPILFIVLFCYLLPVVVLIFTYLLFLLVFYLLPLSLVPALHPSVSSSTHGIFTMLTGLTSPSYCFVLDYHLLM
jgi:hypothetical protein